jgi:hypothetical protein
MLKLRNLLAVCTLLVLTPFLHAQNTDSKSVQAGSGIGTGIGIGSGNGVARVETRLGAIGGTVGTFYSPGASPGQPFSADSVAETDKTLSDGNHIHRETHSKIFRDSQGRTRTETEVLSPMPGNSPFMHIFIMDPVEGRAIILDMEHKTATVSRFNTSRSAGSESETGTQPLAKPRVSMAASPGQVSGLIASTGHVGGGLAALGKHSTEDLGTMTVEGLTVNGTRSLLTMPAGSVGNDKPIITTSEQWYSPDLKMVLLSSSENPESGKQVNKLVNIRTGDPDPLLFQVPPDFELKENPQR